ncbi:MAG: ABC transporter ATP-binding protein [Burkholderiales bacterium]|nr:ABC transporter ATP-binding protein [Burkholderiales bacterium]
MTAPALLEVRGLVKQFPVKKSLFGRTLTHVSAVDGIDFDLFEGETLGVVGESGCGKSTTARLLMHLLEPTAGTIRFKGKTVGTAELSLKDFRRQVQMVFQDSYASLNPRLTVEESIAFGPTVHGVDAREATDRAHGLLDRVGLDPARFAGRFTHELSGGQRQRVNIARALALKPAILVLDEAVSALDKSVEAQVLNLLADLKDEFGLTYLFISHDLEVVRFMSTRVLVMYLGRVAELGPTEALYTGAKHPYTSALLGSLLSMDPDRRTEAAPISGDPPNPIDPPPGCRFHTRCAHAEAACSQAAPQLTGAGGADAHRVACLMHAPGSGHSRAAGRAA